MQVSQEILYKNRIPMRAEKVILTQVGWLDFDRKTFYPITDEFPGAAILTPVWEMENSGGL